MGGFPLGKFIFIHFVVLVSIAFSSSFFAPAALMAVRVAVPHVRVFFSESWSSVEFLLFFSTQIWFCHWGGPIVFSVCIRWYLQLCVPVFLVPLGSQLLH